jgi:predicted nucleotidyltransferase
VEILKAGGCTEVFVFGSVAEGTPEEDSDLDLAMRGCPPGEFFHLWGEFFWQLSRPTDLIDLDSSDLFAQHLQREDRLVRIG